LGADHLYLGAGHGYGRRGRFLADASTVEVAVRIEMRAPLTQFQS
jgi:hypothetical protein